MGAPAGFKYFPDLLTADEEQALLATLAELPLREFQMHGVTAKRRVAHFGWDYGYESWDITPAEPLPDFLLPPRRRAADVAGVDEARLEEALVTRYPPGAGIGWHRDAPMFGDIVIGVSLGAGCTMRFRHPPDSYAQVLEARSMYALFGAARWQWQHSIPPVKAERWSITFRSLRRSSADAQDDQKNAQQHRGEAVPERPPRGKLDRREDDGVQQRMFVMHDFSE